MKEIIELEIPTFYIGYLFNNNPTGLTDDEIEIIDKATIGLHAIEITGDKFFTYFNDLTTKGCDCINIKFIKHDQK